MASKKREITEKYRELVSSLKCNYQQITQHDEKRKRVIQNVKFEKEG